MYILAEMSNYMIAWILWVNLSSFAHQTAEVQGSHTCIRTWHLSVGYAERSRNTVNKPLPYFVQCWHAERGGILISLEIWHL